MGNNLIFIMTPKNNSIIGHLSEIAPWIIRFMLSMLILSYTPVYFLFPAALAASVLNGMGLFVIWEHGKDVIHLIRKG